jgi:hypothetical protein
MTGLSPPCLALPGRDQTHPATRRRSLTAPTAMAVVAKPCHSMTSRDRTWQATPSRIQPHRTRVHPKPPALIRPRACTSLVSMTNRSRTHPGLPGIKTPQLNSIERDATRRTRPLQAAIHPTPPASIGNRACTGVVGTSHEKPDLDATQLTSTSQARTCLTPPDCIPPRPRRSASVPARWWFPNATCIAMHRLFRPYQTSPQLTPPCGIEAATTPTV